MNVDIVQINFTDIMAYLNENLYIDQVVLVTQEDGTLIYMKNGKIHRDGDEPAMISPKGTAYLRNSKFHRRTIGKSRCSLVRIR